MKKNKLAIFCLIALALLLPKVFHFATAGFSFKKVYYQETFDPSLQASPPTDGILAILNQPFHYLGQGRQVFAFESADRKYVLKLVRFHLYRVPFGMKLLSFFYAPTYLSERRKHYQRFFASYKMAFEELGDLTQVVFVHLNPTTAVMPQLQVYDRLQRPVVIDLDKTAFLLQRRGVSLESLRGADLKAAIDAFFQAVLEYKDRKVKHRDLPNLIRNAGWYQGRYMEIDVGSYEKEKEVDDAFFWYRELNHVNRVFLRFLEKKEPALIGYFLQKRKALEERLLEIGAEK
ncbi:MAG: hypothetical protein WC371_04320 [Parachlamydiales bacterium]